MNKLIYILVFCFITPTLSALDTLRAEAGDYIYVKINIPTKEILQLPSNLTATLNVGERTLLQPMTLCAADSIPIDTKLVTENRYAYKLFSNLNKSMNLEQCVYLKCRVLAGATATTALNIKDIKIGDTSIDSVETYLELQYQNKPLYYLRFAKIKNLYPVPIIAGNDLICEFTLDRNSLVDFWLIDSAGNYYRLDSEIYPRGENKYILKSTKSLAAGGYRLRMVSDHGEMSRSFMVIK